MKKVTYWTTVGVGALAMLAMLNPPQFLQDLIVFGSGGLGASFLMPVILTLYWPRSHPEPPWPACSAAAARWPRFI